MSVVSMTEEALYEIVGELDNKTDLSRPSLPVFHGLHAKYGSVTVVISPLGGGVLITAPNSCG